MSADAGAVQVENAVQVALMLAVGGVAAAVSWSHVLDLARGHGQGCTTSAPALLARRAA